MNSSIKSTQMLERIQRLNDIGFIWNLEEVKWNKNYQLLKEYLTLSNGEYPKKNEIYKGVDLYAWITGQKTILKTLLNNKNVTEKQQKKINLLNQIDFLWSAERQFKTWKEYYDLFVEYLNIHNGEYPKEFELYKNHNLFNWISMQRHIYSTGTVQKDGKIKSVGKNILTKERIDLLNQINFIWYPQEEKWNQKYDLLKEYIEIYHKFPQYKTIYKDEKIGIWVITQKKAFLGKNRNKLTKEQIDKLERLRIEWVNNPILYNKNEITKKEELIGLKRLLESKLKRLSEEKIYDFYSKDDVNNFNNQFLTTLYKKKER